VKKRPTPTRWRYSPTLIGNLRLHTAKAGSGKSYLLQMLPLRYIDDARTRCIMFRRTVPQLMGQGGIYETAQDIYGQLPDHARPSFTKKPPEAKFPTGATVRWQSMQLEQNKTDIQGLQFTLIGVDEATQFEWSQLEYMMSRLRSESKYPSRLVMSCNPDPSHQLRYMLEDFYLDSEGYPIPERDGKIRYFIRRDGEFIWSNTREELGESYGIPKEAWEATILSFTFISATIFDNPLMIKNNPSYLAFLEGLNEVDKAQLLHGNWFVEANASGMHFSEEMFRKATHVPLGARYVRGWDTANTQAVTEFDDNYDPLTSKISGDARKADYTVGLKMAKYDGNYYICGMDIFKEKSGPRDNRIISNAKRDGEDCIVGISQDAGAAGKYMLESFLKKCTSKGVLAKGDGLPVTKSKQQKATPYINAVQTGLVYIVESTFTPVQLKEFYKQHSLFDGESRSTSDRHEDIVDAGTTCFALLAKETVIPSFSLPSSNSTTLKKQVMDATVPNFNKAAS